MAPNTLPQFDALAGFRPLQAPSTTDATASDPTSEANGASDVGAPATAGETHAFATGTFTPALSAGIGGVAGPVLPGASTTAASPDASLAATSALGNIGYGVPTGAMAYALIAQALQKNLTLSQQSRIAMQNASNNAQVDSAQAGIKEAKARKDEAGFKLGTALSGTAVSGLAGYVGTRGIGWGATLQAAGQSLSGLTGSIGEAYSQNAGYGLDMAKAQIEKGQDDLQKTMYQQVSDGMGASEKQAQESINQAIAMLQEYNRRQSDTLKAIAS